MFDDKVKLKIINIPINKNGELVLDFKNTESLTLSLYQILRTLSVEQSITTKTLTAELDIETTDGVFKVNGEQVVGEQEPAITGLATGGGTDQDDTARIKINEIIVALRNHGLIIT